MDNHTTGWILLIFILFLTTFGVYWCLTVFASVVIFIIGYVIVLHDMLVLISSYFRLISLLYLQEGDVDKFYRHCAGNPLTSNNMSDGGLTEV